MNTNELLRTALWSQCGAAIQTLEQVIEACPEDLWADRTAKPEYWLVVYHTLFFADLYLSPGLEGFQPPAPFGLSELEDDGVPDRVYTREESLRYVEHVRAKARAQFEAITPEIAAERRPFWSRNRSV